MWSSEYWLYNVQPLTLTPRNTTTSYTEYSLFHPAWKFFVEKMDPGYMLGEVYWPMHGWQWWCSGKLVAPCVAGPGFKSRGGGGQITVWVDFGRGERKKKRNSGLGVRLKMTFVYSIASIRLSKTIQYDSRFYLYRCMKLDYIQQCLLFLLYYSYLSPIQPFFI